jgi:16S rRNA (cytosine1402-N4)-methyltransferase
METQHVPVLLAEAIEYLNCKPNGIYLDATLGSGGHAYTILKDKPEIKWLVALDCDGDAIKKARHRLAGSIFTAVRESTSRFQFQA